VNLREEYTHMMPACQLMPITTMYKYSAHASLAFPVTTAIQYAV
jgi:hypothetical protein